MVSEAQSLVGGCGCDGYGENGRLPVVEVEGRHVHGDDDDLSRKPL